MKILFLTRKFVDGDEVSEYVKALAEKVVSEGGEALILAFDDKEYYSVDDRVEVERVPLHYEGDSLYSWSMMLNNEMKEKARQYFEERDFDVIHANDWMTVPGATAIKQRFEVPVVLTLHSTENERGFESPNAEVISELEWKGCYNADKILVNSDSTRNSAVFDLDAPEQKIEVVDPLGDGWRHTVLKTYENLLDLEEVDVER
ncbi:MAG: glycosyltransferase family 4 protein [Candidatus Nanohaloarchaea archaeon]